jgi:hypothetical protein
MNEGQDITTPESNDDLRATLVAALEAKDDTQATSSDAIPATDATPTDGRVRDQLGRFKSKDASEPFSESEIPADDTTLSELDTKLDTQEATEQEAKEQPAKPASALRPPQSWGASAKAKFGELPPEIQQEVVKRERDFDKGLQQNAGLANFGRSLAEVISPYQAMLHAEGSDPVTVVSDLMKTAYLLRTAPAPQKLQLFRQVAQQFGVDLNGLTAQAEDVYVDPQIAAIQARQQQLEQYLQQQHFAAQQASQASQTQETSRLTSEIEEFSSDPAHPHFEEVRPYMAALLKSGQAQGLDDAYEQATWGRPEIRASLMEAQEAKRKAEAARRAKDAQAAAVSVRGAPHGGSGLPAPKDSLRAEIESLYG